MWAAGYRHFAPTEQLQLRQERHACSRNVTIAAKKLRQERHACSRNVTIAAKKLRQERHACSRNVTIEYPLTL
jgi:hypothetical protein